VDAAEGINGTRPGPPRASAVLLVLIGLALATGGADLAWLGGSSYYLLAGLAIALCGVLLWRGDRRGTRLYGLVFIATLAWSVWESGLYGWALAPRLFGPALLGVWLLTPWVQRGLAGQPLIRRGGTVAAALAVLLAAGVTLAAVLWSAAPWPSASAADSGPVPAAAPSAFDGDWEHYGATQAGTRFSPLAQLTAANVAGLKLAWTYRTGASPKGLVGTLETTPLKVDDTLYLCTGFSDVVALDAETGRQKWRYEAKPNTRGLFAGICRGVAFYRVPGATGPCSHRILDATVDARLLALDARTGRPCAGFGNNGQVDLWTGMGPVDPGYYFVTSPPTIIRGKAVIGGWVTDGQRLGEPPGVVRAYDATTGALAWAWDPGNPDVHTAPPPGASYTLGTPNSWAPMSADERLGLVYAPTGTATPDYYGGYRTADADKYSSSVVALDATTGAVRWSFQTVHHDLWDYDVPAQPTLIDLPGGIPALIQATKRGEIFLLDRRTGRPLAAVAEQPTPQRPVAGDRASPTQPFSVGMPSFRGPDLNEKAMWGITPFDQLWCRIRFRQARYEGPLTPVGLRPTIVYPGYLGGTDWGGVSVDPDRQVMVVNSNRVANYDQLITRTDADRMGLKAIGAHYHGDVGGAVAQAGTPYAAVIAPFLSPLGVPCQQPPFGMLSVIDLKTRKVTWSKPFGTARDSGPLGLESHLPILMGVPNHGGSVVTRGGLIFIAASQERSLRAVDILTGRDLWRAGLPAGGQATPMSYLSQKSGRQFVVIAAGGSPGLRTRAGDYILAYALPNAR
jgi:quinoprotein glucose dehydrogenase